MRFLLLLTQLSFPSKAKGTHKDFYFINKGNQASGLFVDKGPEEPPIDTR